MNFPDILSKWEKDLLLWFNRKLKVLVTKRFYMILPANTLFIFGKEFISTCSLKKKSNLLKIDYLYKIRYVAEQFSKIAG